MPVSERILICAITGGRPKLEDRPTSKHLDDLRAAGYDTAWVIREDQIDGYEPDTHPFETYPVEWADQYARTHWRHPVAKFTAGGFHGAFTGREWAMRLGAAGNYDAVFQLDDNLTFIGPLDSSRRSYRETSSAIEIFKIMQDITFATNVVMCGIQLNSVPAPPEPLLIRPGFPYSAFIEKVSPTRLPYYGPFEDDIMHALDYGLSAAPTTVAIIDAFRYNKTYGGSTGMRSQYSATRGLGIARLYPKNVRLSPGARTSSPTTREDDRGMRHYLNTKGFTPVNITDKARFETAAAAVTRIIELCRHAYHIDSRDKMNRRSATPNRNEQP